MTVCERVFRDFKFELPSTHVKRFVVTREIVDNPRAALERLLAENEAEERAILRGIVHEFADRFQKEHGLKLVFTPAAIDKLIELAAKSHQPLRNLCAERFKDYQFGLKLVYQNTGRSEFTIDVDTVEHPDKALNDWVVTSYRPTGQTNPKSEG